MFSVEWRRSKLGSVLRGGARREKLGVARASAIAWAPAIAALTLGAGGCVDNNQSIFIRQVVAFPEGNCTQTADPSALAIGRGALDVALRGTYQATLLVGSQLIQRGSRQQLREETSRVVLEGTEVYAVDGSGHTVFGPSTVPGSGFVDPASDTTPSYGLISSVLLKVDEQSAMLSSARSGFRPTVTAHVRVFGHTLGGQSVESGEYLFPIDVCYRCLVTFPVDAVTTTAAGTLCNAEATAGTALVGPCAVGQDETVDCRICREHLAGSPVCEPP
jgi:hypothetical protein